MHLLSSFNNFYNNLSSDGLFFFWIIVFLFIFLLFLTIILIIKNNKLTKLLKESKNFAGKTCEEIIANRNEDNASNLNNENADNRSAVIEVENSDKEQYNNIEEENKIKIENVKPQDNGLYKKNVLREMNSRMQTSPIHIDRDEVKDAPVENSGYGIDLGEDTLSPLESMEDNFEVNDNMKFASDIVKKMEEEIKPSNIELTDYEKKQEEEAIISYDELLKVKDKIYNITEDEETDEFIDELKSFRLDL